MASSNLISKILEKLSRNDLNEFNQRAKPKKTFMGNLRLFLHEKYCNAEDTLNREYYGNLCNLTEYPGWYV